MEVLAGAKASPAEVNDDFDFAALVRAAGSRRTTWLLFGVAVVNVIDRQIVNVLAELIRKDLKLSDAQLGLMTGFAFAAFYGVMALPIARLAERWDRARIVAACMALWSLFTIACGLAQSFAQLIVARALVGVGEAGSGPASQSLIADVTPRHSRASALALVTAGVPVGTLIGMGAGGLLADSFGWRVALVAAGAPGLVLAVCVALVVRDPRACAQMRRGPAPPGGAVADLWRRRSYRWFVGGSALLGFANLGILSFLAPLLLRLHSTDLVAAAAAVNGMTGANLGATGVAGPLLGVTLGLSGLAGILGGGALADMLLRRDPCAYMTIPVVASALAGPLFAGALQAPGAISLLLLVALPTTLANLTAAPVMAASQSVVGPRLRATASAVLFLATTLVALGLGPVFVGLASDHFGPRLGEGEGLRAALLCVCLAPMLAAVCFWRARRSLLDDLIS